MNQQQNAQQPAAQMHEHPTHPAVLGRGKTVVFGRRLQPGEVIQPDDVYDSTSGVWEKAPCPGLTLGEGIATIWIRPS